MEANAERKRVAMYQQDERGSMYNRLQGLWLGLGGLFPSSMAMRFGDQRQALGYHPDPFQVIQSRGLVGSSWKDLIVKAMDIVESESLYARRQIMELTVENDRLKAIVDKPDWVKVFKQGETNEVIVAEGQEESVSDSGGGVRDAI